MRANAREGALAHLVERNVRNVKVRGSSPLCSTKHFEQYETLNYPLSLAADAGRLWRDAYRYRCTRTRSSRYNDSCNNCCGSATGYTTCRGLSRTRQYDRYVPAYAHYAYNYYTGVTHDAGYQSLPRPSGCCRRFCAGEQR